MTVSATHPCEAPGDMGHNTSSTHDDVAARLSTYWTHSSDFEVTYTLSSDEGLDQMYLAVYTPDRLDCGFVDESQAECFSQLPGTTDGQCTLGPGVYRLQVGNLDFLDHAFVITASTLVPPELGSGGSCEAPASLGFSPASGSGIVAARRSTYWSFSAIAGTVTFTLASSDALNEMYLAVYAPGQLDCGAINEQQATCFMQIAGPVDAACIVGWGTYTLQVGNLAFFDHAYSLTVVEI